MAIEINNGGIAPVEGIEPITPGIDNVSQELVEPTSTQGPAGLSQQELNDPNSIRVTIADQSTPIVVLYGPPACGKTMTLVRMTRFLKKHGYTVAPERIFRPSFDNNYCDLCDNFDQMMNSDNAANSTSSISFMLVKVLKDGKPICQILEAPGEYYFNPDDPNREYPAYVHAIINGPNRKVWSIMVEPDWTDSTPRANYVTRIANLKTKMSSQDKTLFVFNKIDLTPYVRSAGEVNTKEAIKYIQNLYPGIFAPFKNENPITKFFKEYNCEFVPFMTGSYARTMNGGFMYTEGHESYAKKLWQAMLKLING
ncbi:hypothetical protein [Sodaliphilus sp.]|uniref:hypothetical protein n=1 Tax=Sodaliphilus sp. TaxID=2815818 RepID=UPI003890E9F2